MEPVIAALSKKYEGKVRFIVVDVENQNDQSVPELLKRFGVRFIPAIYLIDRNGQVEEEHVGIVSEEVLDQGLNSLTK